MKFKSIISTITLLCLLSLASCVYNKKTSLEAFKQDVYTPEYATGFKILGAKNAQSTLIQVSRCFGHSLRQKCNNVLLHLPQW